MDNITRDAVMFFDNGDVVKEMLYPEFEAVLDHVVGVEDFKESQIPAVYVRLNETLDITAAVFFYISFDGKGFADTNWNIPLQHLADISGRGPDLGAGAIKLTCRSQCSISWHQRGLWDPDVESDPTTFELLNEKAKRNRLGLIVEDIHQEIDVDEDTQWNDSNLHTPKSDESIEQEIEKKYDSLLDAAKQEHLLRVATIKSEAQSHIEKLKEHYSLELKKVNSVLQSSKQLFTEEKHKNIKLKNTVEKQAENFKKVRESFQNEIANINHGNSGKLDSLEENFELELKAKLDTATSDLKEMLDMREVELFYRDEQIKRINTEITQLRNEKEAMLNSDSDRILHQLVDHGITFVAYQPGIEHVSVPVNELTQYLEEPLNYVAEKCAVDPFQYKQWLNHFELPICNCHVENKSICGVPVVKIDKPGLFIEGESDRCQDHKHTNMQPLKTIESDSLD